MRGRNIYILCMVLFLVIVIVGEILMPKPFSWKPSFNTNDKQPFGSYVFDSLLRQAMPGKYHVRNLSWHDVKTDSTARRSNILITEDDYFESFDDLFALVDSGMNVCIAAMRIYPELFDTLHLSTYYDFEKSKISEMLKRKNERDTLCWKKDSIFSERLFLIHEGLAFKIITKDSIDDVNIRHQTHCSFNITTFYNDTYSDDVNGVSEMSDVNGACVMSCPFGRGRIILCTVPLMFTNYGMLDGDNAQFALRVLSLMDTKRDYIRLSTSVARVNDEGEEMPDTPLQYFVMNPPLRWAIYLALALVVLFMILHIRRRQRAIPVYREPENRQLEFAQLIGTLYHQKGDHGDLLRKKYNYFAEHLRREMLIDIDNEADDRENFQRIAMQTGLPERDIAGYIGTIRQVVATPGAFITEEMLHMYFEKMNQIIQNT